MNMGPQEGAFVKELSEAVKDASAIVLLAPPYVTLANAVEAAKDKY